MQTTTKKLITVQKIVNTPIKKVWALWTEPKHIVKWNNASDDWHTPHAENDLRVGGKFLSRMESKDGSFGFDFSGEYNEVKINERIAYTISDGRKVEVIFTLMGDSSQIVSSFEAESTNPIEMQKDGWQAILDNFKRYAEEEMIIKKN